MGVCYENEPEVQNRIIAREATQHKKGPGIHIWSKGALALTLTMMKRRPWTFSSMERDPWIYMWLQWTLGPKKEHRQLLMARRSLGTLSMTKTRRGPWNLSGALESYLEMKRKQAARRRPWKVAWLSENLTPSR
jgi:hypothetical protein